MLDLAQQAHHLLSTRQLRVATAESCTGGLLGAALTQFAGSSHYYLGGVNAYANEVKQTLIGVPVSLIKEQGAVSAAVAKAMATGIRDRILADVAISITGIAGPGGGTTEKPVGTVWIGFATAKGVEARQYRFSGSRVEIRRSATQSALQQLIEWMEVDVAQRY